MQFVADLLYRHRGRDEQRLAFLNDIFLNDFRCRLAYFVFNNLREILRRDTKSVGIKSHISLFLVIMRQHINKFGAYRLLTRRHLIIIHDTLAHRTITIKHRKREMSCRFQSQLTMRRAHQVKKQVIKEIKGYRIVVYENNRIADDCIINRFIISEIGK